MACEQQVVLKPGESRAYQEPVVQGVTEATQNMMRKPQALKFNASGSGRRHYRPAFLYASLCNAFIGSFPWNFPLGVFLGIFPLDVFLGVSLPELSL